MMDRKELAYHRRQQRRFPDHSCDLPPQTDRVYPDLPPTASRWTRMLRVLRKQISGWRASKHLRALFRSTYTVEAELARQSYDRWWVLHPYSCFVAIWQLLVMLSVALTTFLFPIHYLFLGPYIYLSHKKQDIPDHPFINKSYPPTKEFIISNKQLDEDLNYVARLSETIFILHVILLFITGYYDSIKNEVVLAPSRIVKRYLTTWFALDLLSVLKFSKARERLVMQSYREYDLEGEGKMRIIYYVWTAITLTKIFRLRYLFNYASNWCHMAGARPVIRKGILWVLWFWSFVMWMIYLSYQLPLMIRGVELFRKGSDSWLMDAEIGFFDVNQPRLALRQYLLCLNRVIGVACSHIPHFSATTPHQTMEDTVLLLIMMWVFTAFKIVLFSLMLEYAETISYSEIKLEQIRSQVRMYMREQNLPIHIRNKMMVFYDQKFEGRYFKERAIIAHMPECIRNAVSLAIGRRIVRSNSLFRGMPKALVNRIVRELSEELYMPHDVVFPSGVEARHMYFLCTGTVGVYMSTGEEVAHLEDGAILGVMGLLVPEYRNRTAVSVVALEVCHIFSLERRALERLVRPFPRLYNRIRTEALNRAAEVELEWGQDEVFTFKPLSRISLPRLSPRHSPSHSPRDSARHSGRYSVSQSPRGSARHSGRNSPSYSPGDSPRHSGGHSGRQSLPTAPLLSMDPSGRTSSKRFTIEFM